jgi:hypothetical protein
MELAPQPVRRNLRAKPAPPNLSICAQCASVNSARTLTNSFASYHILVSPAVSYNYALFCATARRYLSYFQWLPHSFYRHGWVPPSFALGACPIRSGGSAAIKFVRPLFSYSYKSLFPQLLSFHIHANPPGGVGCNGFRTVSQQRQSERRCRPEFGIPYFEIFAMKTE